MSHLEALSIFFFITYTTADADDDAAAAFQLHGTFSQIRDAQIAHGVLMSLAVVLFFPFGAILLRLGSSPKIVKYHAICQSCGLLLLIIGYALGAWLGYMIDLVYTEAHEILGTVLTGLFLLQPLLGRFHHRQFVKTGTKSWKGMVHVWLGRILIVVSFINGGCGLKLAANTDAGKIAYSVVVAVVAVCYGGALAWWYLRGSKKTVPGEESVEMS